MNKTVIPAAIESLIEGLVDPTKNKFLKESHLVMVENCIKALQDAVLEYNTKKAHDEWRKRR